MNLENFLNINYLTVSIAFIFTLILIDLILFPDKKEDTFISAFMLGLAFALVYYFPPQQETAKDGLEFIKNSKVNDYISTEIFLGILTSIALFLRFNDNESNNAFFRIFNLGFAFAMFNILFFSQAIYYIFFIPFVALVEYNLMEYDAIEKIAKSDKL